MMPDTPAKPEGKISFITDESGTILPTIQNFYNYCSERRLMGTKCAKCGAIDCPPRAICHKCLCNRFQWVEFKGRGRLLTYTIIHFSPTQFQALAPYAVGIVKLDEGPQLSTMIKNVKVEEIRIGMSLRVDYETAIPKEWPRWARYFFKPA